jgi:hypothetical protein
MYDPTVGRFLSADPIGLAAGPNPYAYCGNGPMTNVDPLGLCEEGGESSSPGASVLAAKTKSVYREWKGADNKPVRPNGEDLGEATVESSDRDTITLRTRDGRRITIRKSDLSAADQAYLQEQPRKWGAKGPVRGRLVEYRKFWSLNKWVTVVTIERDDGTRQTLSGDDLTKEDEKYLRNRMTNLTVAGTDGKEIYIRIKGATSAQIDQLAFLARRMYDRVSQLLVSLSSPSEAPKLMSLLKKWFGSDPNLPRIRGTLQKMLDILTDQSSPLQFTVMQTDLKAHKGWIIPAESDIDKRETKLFPCFWSVLKQRGEGQPNRYKTEEKRNDADQFFILLHELAHFGINLPIEPGYWNPQTRRYEHEGGKPAQVGGLERFNASSWENFFSDWLQGLKE